MCVHLMRKPSLISWHALLSGAAIIAIPRINRGIANMNPTTGKTTSPNMNNNIDITKITKPIDLLEKRSFLHSFASMIFS
jgi:hypothetical protein